MKAERWPVESLMKKLCKLIKPIWLEYNLFLVVSKEYDSHEEDSTVIDAWSQFFADSIGRLVDGLECSLLG